MKTSVRLHTQSRRESFSQRRLNHISRLITLQTALIGKLPILKTRWEVREREREMREIIIPRSRSLISLSLFSRLTCAVACVRACGALAQAARRMKPHDVLASLHSCAEIFISAPHRGVGKSKNSARARRISPLVLKACQEASASPSKRFGWRR